VTWSVQYGARKGRQPYAKGGLIPVLQYPDGTFRGETNRLADDLEVRHVDRSVITHDKA
jgi:hypothetical protein